MPFLKELIKDKEDMTLTTRMEHHANDLPFRRVGKMAYVEVDELGRVKGENDESGQNNSDINSLKIQFGKKSLNQCFHMKKLKIS